MNAMKLFFGLLADAGGGGGVGGLVLKWQPNMSWSSSSNVTSITNSATLFNDVGTGDTTTGHQVQDGSNTFNIVALADFGASQSVTRLTVDGTLSGGGGGFNLWGSNDGTSWTSIYGQGFTDNIDQTFSVVSYRYYVLHVGGGGGAGVSYRLNDFRLYNGATLLIPTV
jgi:hypothetical protein